MQIICNVILSYFVNRFISLVANMFSSCLCMSLRPYQLCFHQFVEYCLIASHGESEMLFQETMIAGKMRMVKKGMPIPIEMGEIHPYLNKKIYPDRFLC